MSFLYYLLAIISWYLSGILAAWLLMSIFVILIVKNKVSVKRGEYLKQLFGSLGQSYIGFVISRLVLLKFEIPSQHIYIFFLATSLISISLSKIAPNKYNPHAQTIGSIIGCLILYLQFYL